MLRSARRGRPGTSPRRPRRAPAPRAEPAPPPPRAAAALSCSPRPPLPSPEGSAAAAAAPRRARALLLPRAPASRPGLRPRVPPLRRQPTARRAAAARSEMSAVLRELLRVSEKAADIARACRQQEALFQLLIEEKKGGEKNKKFAVDFKTLADVLVQEVIKQSVEDKFPGLGKKVLGEESNEFTNDLGEKMIVRLCPTEEETAELLSRVLGGNKLASEALARVVHQDVTFGDPALDAVEVDIPQDTLGIWVDPIDSTYQYIKGSADIKSNQGIFPSGLQCVTILIGVYDLHTGVPLMGVINQPFVSQDLNTLRLRGTETRCVVIRLENNVSNTDECDRLPLPTEKLSSTGGKDSATGAFLTRGPTSIRFSFPTPKERVVTRRAEGRKTPARRASARTGFQPSSARVRRTASEPPWRVCVASACSRRPGPATRASALSKAWLTCTSSRTTPRSSGTRAPLTPSCGPWAGGWWISAGACGRPPGRRATGRSCCTTRETKGPPAWIAGPTRADWWPTGPRSSWRRS
ncbi:inositol polyphosphate 1-phosphatase isoform X1 [Mustela lutreola]|uniref:inositol polyphosphate 1-phosphatase isoform X1 n=1 Tax=Mustela lutreola TaxID=9666 RepID=UPI002796EE72|nr:inositol polyphosphate 1-phosphatase isoform X1 [Mustela lutreola]